MRQVGLLTTVPILLVTAPIIGFLIGQFLDKKAHTTPLLSIVFLIFGFVAAALQVAKIVRLANRQPRKKD